MWIPKIGESCLASDKIVKIDRIIEYDGGKLYCEGDQGYFISQLKPINLPPVGSHVLCRHHPGEDWYDDTIRDYKIWQSDNRRSMPAIVTDPFILTEYTGVDMDWQFKRYPTLLLSVNKKGVISLWDDHESRPKDERHVDLVLTPEQERLIR